MFKFNEAISFQVHCDTQDEIDHYWEKLVGGRRPEGPAVRLAQGPVRRVVAGRPPRHGRDAQGSGVGSREAGDGGRHEDEEARHRRTSEGIRGVTPGPAPGSPRRAVRAGEHHGVSGTRSVTATPTDRATAGTSPGRWFGNPCLPGSCRMRKAITYAVGLGCAGVAVMALAQATGQQPPAPAPNPDSQYRLGPDSLPQEGVPKGEISGPFTLPSQVYPGTQHTYWVYVPAQYDPAVPAALMVFQDGQAFKDEKGDMRAQNVMDNLIYRREIPVMIGVFINPGRRPDQPEPTPAELGRPRHQPADRVQLARRQVRPGHHRGTDAGAGEGLQHLEGPGDARHRRVEFRGDRGVHGRLGAARPLPQGAEQRRQLRQPARRARLPGEGAGEPRRSRSASTCATAGTTTAASATASTTRRGTGSTRTCG